MERLIPSKMSKNWFPELLVNLSKSPIISGVEQNDLLIWDLK